MHTQSISLIEGIQNLPVLNWYLVVIPMHLELLVEVTHILSTFIQLASLLHHRQLLPPLRVTPAPLLAVIPLTCSYPAIRGRGMLLPGVATADRFRVVTNARSGARVETIVGLLAEPLPMELYSPLDSLILLDIAVHPPAAGSVVALCH